MSIGPIQFESFIERLLGQLRLLHEQIGTIRDTQEANRKAQQQIIAALSDLRETENEKRENRTRHNQIFSIQVILTVGTWFAFIAAAIYAGIAAQQATTMHETYREIHQQTVDADATAKAAQDSLSQTRDQFRTELRPYIGLANAGFAVNSYLVNDGPKKGHMAVVLYYANYGKSPALHLRYNGFIALGDKAPTRVKWHKITDPGNGIIVPPGETKGQLAAYSEELVGPDEFKDVGQGKIPMIFFGHLEYTDMFGDPQPLYTTEFCMASTTTPVITNTSIEAICDGHTNMK